MRYSRFYWARKLNVNGCLLQLFRSIASVIVPDFIQPGLPAEVPHACGHTRVTFDASRRMRGCRRTRQMFWFRDHHYSHGEFARADAWEMVGALAPSLCHTVLVVHCNIFCVNWPPSSASAEHRQPIADGGKSGEIKLGREIKNSTGYIQGSDGTSSRGKTIESEHVTLLAPKYEPGVDNSDTKTHSPCTRFVAATSALDHTAARRLKFKPAGTGTQPPRVLRTPAGLPVPFPKHASERGHAHEGGHAPTMHLVKVDEAAAWGSPQQGTCKGRLCMAINYLHQEKKHPTTYLWIDNIPRIAS
ncbi:hypothetical protein GGX14DRAFT_409213 [Mycena pura]|uniref:Uncharacterized protein n=1 Tax=Mycena pura TaxID=153505 RepID=A0AAD6UJL8_9AGAR|nr:hypothetical protein GGX14DRAFT_409213 [Mycena pura]